MGAKVLKIILMAGFLLLPVYFLLFSGAWMDSGERSVTGTLDAAVRRGIPFAQELEQLGLDLRIFGGKREQNGVFISENGLMRNIAPPVRENIDANTDAISQFSKRLAESSSYKKSTYFAVIPTAAGILQQNLPRYSQSQTVNQQRQIEEIYRSASSEVRTVDVYSALQNRRNEYIYYRTDNGLTALGGYHIYTAIARRMNHDVLPVSQFHIEYVDHSFYGNLYNSSPETGREGTAPYRKVEPDILSVYSLNKNREFRVQSRTQDKKRTYHTLYPLHQLQLDRSPLDIYLGGPAAVTDIRTSSSYSRRLLVFGDETARAYLPFLVNHYQRVTWIDLGRAESDDLADISPEQYDQVLFAYGIETLIHSDVPSRVQSIRWQSS